MRHSKSSPTVDRRRLLKALASSGVVVTAGSVPLAWKTPVVDTVLLPAHAQTTIGADFFGSQTLVADASPGGLFDNFARIRDKFISEAHAGGQGPFAVLIEIAATITSATGYNYVMKMTEVYPCQISGTGEFSSFHTGSGVDGVATNAAGTGCDNDPLPATLTIVFLNGQLRASGNVDGAFFDFLLNPGGNNPQPSLCVLCIDDEQ